MSSSNSAQLFSRQAFSEFRGVHRDAEARLPLWIQALNPLIWWVEEKKIRLKILYQSFSKLWE
jgi:hypothetical protein